MDPLTIFWNEFLHASGLNSETHYEEAFHFELSEYWANELLRLVLIGQKRATASSFFAFALQKEKVPAVGDYNILTDWGGTPRCVTRVTQVTILPFKDMTFEICRREGEDETLESWQRGHRRFFQEEGADLGYAFTEDMPVVFEDFEVVYPRKL